MGKAGVEELDGTRPGWQQQARCAAEGLPPELFIPGLGYDERKAKVVCNGTTGPTGRCPVRSECLQAALAGHEPGVWGGTNGAERRRMIRVERRL